jgi:GNAT superfamily N-acetyltransferase
MEDMPTTLSTPSAEALPAVVEALAAWQQDGLPLQLHSGDLGWAWQIGAPALAERVRVWARDARIVAVGFLDGPTLLRLAVSPDAGDDRQLAGRMLADISDPSQGVLPKGPASIEARFGPALRAGLGSQGWADGELWTPFTLGLSGPLPDPGIRIEVAGPETAQVRAAVQNAAFNSSAFTEVRWHAMAAGPAYREARCLLGYDAAGTAVATATVWSAGVGRTGLLEPVGVPPEHRGRGYGAAITRAAVSALKEMGASMATVCAETANSGALAAYASAGFHRHADVSDFHRPG